eukprot:6962841-Alexandrium_andersonii.AAC.1
MSASLVGSEMCIRDRLGDWRLRVRRTEQSRLWARGSSSAFHVSSGPSFAVSYTHLTLPTICSV